MRAAPVIPYRLPRLTRGPQLARFRQILYSARNTDFYLPLLRTAHLDTANAISELDSVEEGLSRLAPVDLGTVLAHREEFRNRSLHAPEPIEFRDITTSWWRLFPPEEIAGNVAALERFAARVRAGGVTMPPTVRRLTVHTPIDRDFLNDAERERLWEAFGLPVFEQVRGLDGEILAWECNAHNGLHVQHDHAIVEAPAPGENGELVLTSLGGQCYPLLRVRTGRRVRRAGGLCGCGEKALRLLPEAGIWGLQRALTNARPIR